MTAAEAFANLDGAIVMLRATGTAMDLMMQSFNLDNRELTEDEAFDLAMNHNAIADVILLALNAIDDVTAKTNTALKMYFDERKTLAALVR